MERPALNALKGSAESGHALVSSLVALLIVGSGSSGLARWTVDLLLAARAQAQQEWALSLLHDEFESAIGSDSSKSADIHGTTFTVRSGVPVGPGVGEPACGVHLEHTVQWTDPWGRLRVLSLRTHGCVRARAY